MYQYAVVQLGY